MSQAFDFFTGATLESKLAVILSWHYEFEEEYTDGLADLICQIPDFLDDEPVGVSWFEFFDALGSYPNLAEDADLTVLYQRAHRRVTERGKKSLLLEKATTFPVWSLETAEGAHLSLLTDQEDYATVLFSSQEKGEVFIANESYSDLFHLRSLDCPNALKAYLERFEEREIELLFIDPVSIEWLKGSIDFIRLSTVIRNL